MKKILKRFSLLTLILGNERGEIGVQGKAAGTMAGGQGGNSTGEAAVTTQESGTQAASSESGTQAANTEEGAFSVDSLPQAAQDLIKSLRGENADHRTKNNNLMTRMEKIEGGLKGMFGDDADQESTPEEKLSTMQQSHENLSFENAVMGLAYENGIPMDNFEYFNFLMDKQVNGLEEGQELSEETLMEVIQKAKGFSQGGQDNTSTTVNDKGQHNAPNQETGVTLDSFVNMGVIQKSELYRKQPAVYSELMKQAKEKRLLK